MGAGYTRWFREGGNIELKQDTFFDGWNWIALPNFVFVKPVWPLGKIINIGPGKEEMYFFTPGTMIFDNLIKPKDPRKPVFLSTMPHRDWMKDFFANLNEYNTTNYVKYQGIIREVKVPVDKKQRFIEAGGSFQKKINPSTIGHIVLCMQPGCILGARVEIHGTTFIGHGHTTTGAISSEKTKEFIENRTHNFENILQNTKKNVWVASRDRRFRITERATSLVDNLSPMADKHLVSTMRYLVAAWEEIKPIVINNLARAHANGASGAVEVKIINVRECKHAPDLYSEILPCWPTLVNETVHRFGSDALTALLDGY